jgi:plastocyanin
MQIPKMVALIAACTAVACGGGEKKPSAGATTSAAPPVPSAAAAPGVPQPITGKTWDVKMIGDATGSRFDPPTLTIKPGDGVRWTVVSGVPHNVAFWPDSIPAGTAGVLQGNMTQTMAPLSGPMLTNLSQTYTMSFGGAPVGTYHYYCVPHLALGMKGTITVQ